MLASLEIHGIQTGWTFLNREEINTLEHNSKHNIVTAELEQVKQIESEIAMSDSDVLQKRLEQGRLLASLKNNVQGIEVWEKWVPANLGFSRKNADNYVNLAKWYIAHFDDGTADKEAHLAAIKQAGGRCEYRHDGFTSFNSVYELLSKRARKVKAASMPAKKGRTKAKATKPPKISQKQKLVLLVNDNAKLVRAVQSLDPKHPILSEINMSILPEGKSKPDLKQRKRSGGSPAKKPMKGKKAATPEVITEDRLAA
jgi:hypothetical protein